MKKLLIAFLLVASLASAQSVSTVAPGYPLNANTCPIGKLVAPATPTITLGAAATQMSPLPAGTIAVYCTARGGDVHYGSSSVLSNTTGVWPIISSGSHVLLNVYPGTSQPQIYFYGQATGSTPIVRFIAVTQK